MAISTGMKIGLIAVCAMFLFGGGCAMSLLGFRSGCVRAEAGIKAQYKQNQNNYDNMWKKFKELSQVPAMYVEDLKKVYDSAIKGRYGADGSKATMQWITEHNPNFDSAMYTKIQTAIEAGRNSFEADQKQLIAKKEQYEILLNGTTSLYANPIFNFPRIELDQFDIVTSDETQEVFRSGKSQEVKLR